MGASRKLWTSVELAGSLGHEQTCSGVVGVQSSGVGTAACEARSASLEPVAGLGWLRFPGALKVPLFWCWIYHMQLLLL
jgi:hypothetical protein